MSELNRQTVMTDFVEAEPEARGEGWDADGNLVNPAADAGRLSVLAAEINMLERSAQDTFKRTALEIGRRLTEARGMVPEGRWGEWLETNVAYSTRKAQQLIEVYVAYGGKALPESYEKLSFTQIYDLLAVNDEDRRDALAEAAAGEGLSTRELKARIKALEAEKEANNRKIYDLIQEGEAAERAIKQQQEALEKAQSAEEAARKTADKMRKVSSKAADEADISARRAADAVQRANETAEALRAAEARIRELESREREVEERVPEAVTAELEDLRRQLEQARGAGDETARAILALNLQVRMLLMDIGEKGAKAKQIIETLEALDAAQAAARRAELQDAAEKIGRME